MEARCLALTELCYPFVTQAAFVDRYEPQYLRAQPVWEHSYSIETRLVQGPVNLDPLQSPTQGLYIDSNPIQLYLG